jgi:pimeloyl-ACP methyl ester carboxylesterase
VSSRSRACSLLPWSPRSDGSAATGCRPPDRAIRGDAIEYLQKAAFENGFANGLPAKEAATLFATQAAPVYSTLTAPSGPPAWKTIPSWYVLGTADHAIPPAVQLYMARRIHAHITKVHADHLSMIEAPGVVAKVIEKAAKATS